MMIDMYFYMQKMKMLTVKKYKFLSSAPPLSLHGNKLDKKIVYTDVPS